MASSGRASITAPPPVCRCLSRNLFISSSIRLHASPVVVQDKTYRFNRDALRRPCLCREEHYLHYAGPNSAMPTQ
ncbi:hypothetical protein E2C01_071471 [Portunus trituberculatus]|uniref:Uncharacterized protein n=1 Tax=Portunus trituberculatus TaxID=210409 RepID=A0A5B7I021_PORTR|nr:hypothetical protein [Portunus trituberculatus]